MNNLYQTQLLFQQYLEGENNDIEQQIDATEDALAEHRLAAYYNAYRARLIEALAIDFPAIHAYLGEDDFNWLVIHYIKKHPSTYRSVRWVGKDFASFIRQYEHQECEFLYELALFEWTKTLTFDSQDTDTLFQIEDMSNISPEQWPELTFKFISSLYSLDLHYNVSAYWLAVNEQKQQSEIECQEIPARWIIWRKDLDSHWRSLEVHEAWALAQAQQGLSFGEICEGLTEWIDAQHVAIQAASFLKQWISEGLIQTAKI